MKPIDLFLSKLQGVKREGKGYRAFCSAHEADCGGKPSLTINEGDNGTVLFKCWTRGCSFDSIVAAMGLTQQDMFPSKMNGNGTPHRTKVAPKPRTRYATIEAAIAACERGTGGRHVAPWDYETEHQFHVVRLNLAELDPDTSKPRKQFRPFHHDGQGYVIADPPGPLPLYRHARLKDATTVYIFEGERKVHVAESIGLVAATSSHGAKSAAKTDWSIVRGKHIVIVPDADSAGRDYAEQVARLCTAAGAASVRIVELPGLTDGQDIVEFVDNRECVEADSIRREIEALADAAPPWTPPTKEGKPSVDAPANVGQGLTRRLADAITPTDHFAIDAGGKLYVFDGGVYQPVGEARIRQRVKALLNQWEESDGWSMRRTTEVAGYIGVDAPRLWERPPLDRVNVLNGILEIESRTLRPHDPAFLSPVQIPVAFDPAETCPVFDKFVADVFPSDAHAVAWEIIAWLMLPDVSIQKAILLIGEGSNGKSVFLSMVITFLGKRNVVTVPLHKLESDRFSVSRLVGKLANICADLPSAHLAGTSMFKALTGGDTITGERKHVDSFDFDPYARLIFSANHPPRSEDSTHAFFRRWIVVPFTRTFDPADPDFIPRDKLDAMLADPAELSGVLNKALDALAGLRTHGFTESASMKEAWSDFRETTDPLAVWLDASTIEHPETFTPKSELQASYNRSREAVGEPSMTNMAFGLAIRRLRPSLKDAQRTVGGRVVKVWLGVGLKASSTSPTSPTSLNCAYPRQGGFEGYREGE